MSLDTSPPLIVGPGKITRVVLHGRGALITRQITLPESITLPDTDEPYTLTLRVPGITARANHHHIRARLHADSPHQILSLQGTWAFSDIAPVEEEELGHRIQIITQRLAHIARCKERLAHQRAALDKIHFSPARHRSWLEHGPLARIDHALDLSALLMEHAHELDTQTEELMREHAALREELDALIAERAQQSSTLQRAEQDPSTTVEIELRCAPHHAILPFELSYIIEEARWWPMYTLRLTEQGQQAELSLEAMIAQNSGEDWEEVAIDLSTAELYLDATLPTLPALKLGKAQPPRRTGFRAPPQDTARLFGAYEQFEAHHRALFPLVPSTPAPPAKPLFPDSLSAPAAPAPSPGGGSARAGSELPSRSSSGAVMASMDRSQVASAPLRKKREAHDEVTRKHDVIRELQEEATRPASMLGDLDDDIPSSSGAGPLDISDQWLVYTSLQLGEGKARGELIPMRPSQDITHGSLSSAEAMASKRALLDPLHTRGHYDYRYRSSARHTIASDGLLHRVDIQQCSTTSTLSYQCVPLEAQEVFRIATITNPLSGPMLGGPMDVFIGGSFLLTTTQHHVDQGAMFKVGLGVEKRIRVARNVRTEEEQLGLLGGKTSVLHVITTELTSNLGHNARIQLLERVPIPGEDEVQVKEIGHEPAATIYHHEEANLPKLEGGRSWQITLEPGEKKQITSRYAIILSSKLEVHGGNRRD